jgi:hypothetical protein
MGNWFGFAEKMEGGAGWQGFDGVTGVEYSVDRHFDNAGLLCPVPSISR